MANRPHTIINNFPKDDCEFGIPDKYLRGISSLGYEAYRLAMYYMNCKTGFAPAAATITSVILIDRPHIIRARHELEVNGVIKVDNINKTITVLWDKILLRGAAVASFDLYRNEYPTEKVTNNQMLRQGKFFAERDNSKRVDSYLGNGLTRKRSSHQYREKLDDVYLQRTLDYLYAAPVSKIIAECEMLGHPIPEDYYEKAAQFRKRCEEAEKNNILKAEYNKELELPEDDEEDYDNSDLPF